MLVILFHLPFAPAHRIAIVRNGHVAVEFFFVLSGFVLYHAYRIRLNKIADLPRFIQLRLARIYPVHIFFTVIFVAIEIFKAVGPAGAQVQVRYSMGKIFTAFVENALLIQGLGLRQREIFLNFPSWSISTEFFTYILFGVGLVVWSRRFVMFSAVTCVTAFAGIMFLDTDSGEFQQFVRCIAGFFLGCLTYAAYLRVKRRDPGFDFPGLLLIVILIGLSLNWPSDKLFWEFGFLAAAAFILALVATTPRSTTRLLESKPLRWLGKISYSLYMGHALVLYVARHSIYTLLGSKADSVLWGSLYYALTVVATVAFGWLVFHLIEFPVSNWVKAGAFKRPIPAVPTA